MKLSSKDQSFELESYYKNISGKSQCWDINGKSSYMKNFYVNHSY